MSPVVCVRRKRSNLSLALVPLMVACGGGGASGGGGGGGGGDGGGGGGGDVGVDAVACVTPAAITGAPTNQTAADEVDPPTPGSGSDGSAAGDEEIDYEAMLGAEALKIQLWSGSLDYPGSTVGPETDKSLTGSDAQYLTCGTCVVLFGDLGSDSQGDPTVGEEYLATGGTVTITSTATTFTGTLTNVTFTEVDFDSSTGMTTPSSQGCTTGIASLSFSAPLTRDTGSAVAASR